MEMRNFIFILSDIALAPQKKIGQPEKKKRVALLTQEIRSLLHNSTLGHLPKPQAL